MGIDYNSVSGIGVYVEEKQIIDLFKNNLSKNIGIFNYYENLGLDITDENVLCDNIGDIMHLSGNLDLIFYIKQYGSYYDGDFGYFICTRDLFEDGIDKVQEKLYIFKSWLQENNFNSDICLISYSHRLGPGSVHVALSSSKFKVLFGSL